VINNISNYKIQRRILMDSKKLIEELSNAYGAPGFEEEVLDVVAKYSEELKIESDTMNNQLL
jgi:putative aminopeptidase FrvX